jgi:hypothetical protein
MWGSWQILYFIGTYAPSFEVFRHKRGRLVYFHKLIVVWFLMHTAYIKFVIQLPNPWGNKYICYQFARQLGEPYVILYGTEKKRISFLPGTEPRSSS